MKKDDLQNIYGEVPAGFHHSVMNALCHLDEKAEVKHRSNKKVLKVVLVCALISAIGVAEVTAVTKEIFTRLVLESEQTLYRISVSMLKNESDCQDAVQSAILTAYEKLSDLKHEEYFKTWLTRILINVCNKQLKYRSRFTELSEDIPQMTDDTSREVRDAIDKLPVKIRQAVVLYYIEEFSVKEIKQILKVPEGTVKSRLSKGRRLLSVSLGSQPEQECFA